jgi:RNA 3'-terminal phosphate cyclase (ATP)
MIVIDGSSYSGSGTILRYGVALATLMGRALRVTNIRAKRPKPGLRHQHLAAVLACVAFSGGRVDGAEVGSQEIAYYPGPCVNPGRYAFDVGSAGSTTLLSFSLMIPALYAAGPCAFTLTGGLFQDFAPSAFHMKHCLLALLARMGARVSLHAARPGYVPQGQGRLTMTVEPLTGPLQPLRLLRQGKVGTVRGISLASHLAEQRVARRMAHTCTRVLQERGLTANVEIREDTSAAQRGAALMIWTAPHAQGILGAGMAGAQGRSSERIGTSVAADLLTDLSTGATVDRHLADQLVIFAALADGTTSYRIPEVTDHVETNLWLVQEILGAKTDVQGNVVTVQGIGRPCRGLTPRS